MKPITRTEAIRQIKLIPTMTARHIADGEIRVAKKGVGQEGAAYYTNDPQDALDTAKILATYPTK